VLIDFEGKYTRGFVDGSDNTPDNTITLLPSVMEEADAFIEANKSAIRKSLDRLALVEKSIEGYETPFGMELLSKVHWVINHDKIDINRREEIIRAAREWNPRKEKLLKPEYIDKAIKRIASFGNAD
jgi:hypothetical protein